MTKHRQVSKTFNPARTSGILPNVANLHLFETLSFQNALVCGSTLSMLERLNPMRIPRSYPLIALMFIVSATTLPSRAQSIPCAAITRNPQVLESLLDSHSKEDADADLQDDTINAAQLEHLKFSPIVIQPGDALYVEYRGRDFTVDADFTSGDRTAFDSSPKGSYEQWRKGILPLDMFPEALSQRLVRLRATAKDPNQVLFRNIKIIRAGKPVFEFASLASYGKPRVRRAVERQLPCVGFDDVPANGSSTAVSYSALNLAQCAIFRLVWRSRRCRRFQ